MKENDLESFSTLRDEKYEFTKLVKVYAYLRHKWLSSIGVSVEEMERQENVIWERVRELMSEAKEEGKEEEPDGVQPHVRVSDLQLQLKMQESEHKKQMREAIRETIDRATVLGEEGAKDLGEAITRCKSLRVDLFKKYNCEECHHHVTSKSDGKCVKCGEQVLVEKD